ncbi:hypothetical protein E2C01_095763 [Portunus trituberculatus]|uniref:Uncharacterized protein n=1 Tax=Portunus trituberculatus TaxID=210409 RepID=A0A5B7JZP0_PORTR|nr:hypothetical protein [Portunus trituberculatus]
MDSDQYVPVYILANCTQFKTITKDHSIIVEALKGAFWGVWGVLVVFIEMF